MKEIKLVEKAFFVWLDILGFDKLASEIADTSGLDSEKVRLDFINVINDRVKAIEDKKEILGKKYGKSDDWLLYTSSLDLAFKNVFDTLDHKTGYRKLKVPLEFAIGLGEYDKWSKLEGKNLTVRQSTIDFLKTNIIEHHHEWYKKCHNGQSPTTSFVVMSELAYLELEPLDRRICKRVSFEIDKKRILFYVVNLEAMKQRVNIFKFLEKIKRQGSKLYDRIDDLYVPPNEYCEIKAALKTNRIVFITGTAEYGKTYTAARLLWEYFNKGYTPVWIEGREERERVEVRKRLEEIERELKPRHIIYFEDPFGKINYERAESLEREIGVIIDCVKQVEDVYVVLTSREEVFKEFAKEHMSSKKLGNFEKKLNIKKPSYNVEKREEILLKWAKSKKCIWLRYNNLKRFILELLENEENLPTPLSIKDFVVSTVAITDPSELSCIIKEKSMEASRSFAKELRAMADDKILFLLFPFVHALPTEFVKAEYEKMVKSLVIKEPWDFEEVLEWFKDDKIDVSEGRIRFSHPSYLQAVELFLAEKRQPTRISQEILSKLLLLLSEEPIAAPNVASTIQRHFDRIPMEVRNNLLVRLAKNQQAAPNIVWALAENIEKIPEETRKLLPELAKKPETRDHVTWALAENIEKLPKEITRLLFELAEEPETALSVAGSLRGHFNKLPEKVRNELLRRLAKEPRATPNIVWALTENMNELPEEVRNELLLKLAKEPRIVGEVAWTFRGYFDLVSEETRNELLFELAKHLEAIRDVGWILKNHFELISEEVRNELLMRFVKEPKQRGL